MQRRLLGETEVGQFKDAVSFFGGVQQVLRLVRRPTVEGEKKKYTSVSQYLFI